MPRFVKKFLIMCLSMAVYGVTYAIHAADPPSVVRPDAVSREDVYRVDGVYLDNGQIVLDDRMFRFNASTLVYRPNGSTGAMTDLRRGMRVNIRALHESSQPFLTHIRILR